MTSCGCMLKDTENMFREIAFKEEPKISFGELTQSDINFLNSTFLRLDTFNLYVQEAGIAAEADYDRLRNIIQGTAGVLQGRITDLRTYVDATFRSISSDVGALRTTAEIQAQEIVQLGTDVDKLIKELNIKIESGELGGGTGECPQGDIACIINNFFGSLGVGFAGAGVGIIIVLVLFIILAVKK